MQDFCYFVVGVRPVRFNIPLRDPGTLTLPRAWRQRYRYGPGDVFDLADVDGVFVLSPKTSLVATLAAEIEQERDRAGVSTEALLQAAREERHGE